MIIVIAVVMMLMTMMMMMMMMMMRMVTCNLREIAALARLCLWINPALVQLHCGFLLLPVLLLLTGELLEVTLTHFFEDGADFDHGLLRVIHTHTRTHTHARARAHLLPVTLAFQQLLLCRRPHLRLLLQLLKEGDVVLVLLNAAHLWVGLGLLAGHALVGRELDGACVLYACGRGGVG